MIPQARIRSQLMSEEQLLQLLAPIYQDLGGDPSDLVSVVPSYGGWLNALRFCVSRADSATTWVTRRDIEAEDRRQLTKAMRSFTYEMKSTGTGV